MKYYIISIIIYIISYILARKKLNLVNKVFKLKYGHDVIWNIEVIIFAVIPLIHTVAAICFISIGLFTSYEKLYEKLNGMMEAENE